MKLHLRQLIAVIAFVGWLFTNDAQDSISAAPASSAEITIPFTSLITTSLSKRHRSTVLMRCD
jgi:hypothetical protein